MELRQLRYFVVLARTLNFTRAAAELFVVQSALSQQIARLEAGLGVRLVERTSRRVRLTEAGEHLARRAEVLLRMCQDLEAEIAEYSGAVRGSLRLGLTQGLDGIIDVAGVLDRFHARHPAVVLSVKEARTARVADDVLGGRLELGVVGTGAGTLPDGLSGVELGREQLVVVVSPDHALAGRQRVGLAEVAEAGPLIDPADETRLYEIIDTAWARAGVPRTTIMQVLELGQMARYAARGIGAALVPMAALRGISPPPGQAAFRTIGLDERIGYPVTLIFQTPTPTSPAARELLVEVAESLGPDTDAGHRLRHFARSSRPGRVSRPGRRVG